jgi:hypothetical protein
MVLGRHRRRDRTPSGSRVSDATGRERLPGSDNARDRSGRRLPAEFVNELADLLAQILVADLQQFPDPLPEDLPDRDPLDQE